MRMRVNCGELACAASEYCASDRSCRSCKSVCDTTASHTYNKNICNEQCSDYVLSQLDDITRTKMDAQINTSLALSVTALVVAILAFVCFCAIAFRVYWMIREQSQFSSPLRALFCLKRKSSGAAPPASTTASPRPHLTVATVEAAAAAAAAAAVAGQNGSSPSDTKFGATPGTPGTSMTSLTSRRHPREDCSFSYAAYDNPALSGNHHSTPNTPKQAATVVNTPSTARVSPKESSF